MLIPTMASGQVKPFRTVVSPEKAKSYLRKSFLKIMKRNPTSAELQMLAAHSAMETRRWQAMWWYNFGNSVATSSTKTWYTLKEASKHRYKAFKSAQEGSDYFVNLLKNRFSKAWSVLGSENPRLYAQALKEDRYYEAPIDKYTESLQANYASV